ncbi:hypothetical protein V6N12_058150 [Hibiscus sabdariffa]|uniref:RNase H type-1 domain-containing protein n=1 Tax=Hibiscus sabdariffa TaxID=183260 RepID=A0ABR1ZPK8_9ROSI
MANIHHVLRACPTVVATWQALIKPEKLNFDSSSGTSSLILHVQNLISCDWEVTTQNLFKEGNKVADRFARAVRLEDLGVMVHYRPRLEVVAMFQQDR